MKNIKSFQLGEPKTPEQLKLRNQHNAMFLFSEDGKEWYHCQKDFAEDTIKVAYDEKGIIRSIAANNDISTLWPVGLSVAEVANTTANRRADISGGWVFDGKAIVKRSYSPDEYQEQAKKEQVARIAAVARHIAPLQDAVDLDMATEEEKALLADWKKYRVMLNRLDMTSAPEIDWPVAPCA
ncbi:TPA: tail fiber assembly protein [Serratia marcescens]|nr:tail fiber assembly protein [Serratia marcescens]HEB0066103.1 tail fiber assembly protein [Serratia marcescens]HEB0071113.1 tail fiber assembly protein [Serratia marcescens]HEB0089611.1 tail fiber assembly protein [Serratia marcescens]HEB0126210.1 tail fiber assembly protein [Serratia marcescens]